MKTLDQVEARIPIASLPYCITNNGSYYLTTNLTDRLGTNGIIISANYVTLDLNGFALLGAPTAPPLRDPNASGVSLTGITVSSNCVSVTIRNGTIANWGSGWGTGDGIWAPFSTGVVCERLTVSDNMRNGITIGAPILENGTPGDKCLIHDCIVARNWRTGISARGGVISNCTISENADGLVLFHGQVRNCVVRNSSDQGIIAVNSTVTECEVLGSDEDGIEADGSCQILNNRIAGTRGSPGYALKIAGQFNRVEGNTVLDNNYGVFAEGTNNVIVKNTFSQNGVDWHVSNPEKNTAPAPIAPGSAITNASPWANIVY